MGEVVLGEQQVHQLTKVRLKNPRHPPHRSGHVEQHGGPARGLGMRLAIAAFPPANAVGGSFFRAPVVRGRGKAPCWHRGAPNAPSSGSP